MKEDRLQELDIMVAQICESIYRKCYEGKMSDAESDYFISSVVSNLTMGIAKDTRKKLRGDNDPVIEAIKENNSKVDERPEIDFSGVKYDIDRPQGEWIIVDDTEKFIAKCSVCGRIEDSRMVKDYPYCPCGARMKGC